jgi:nucleoside-diphosphate-sugar epimerase
MKYLVTGGGGFIGSNIVEELLKKGHSVRVLDNFSTGRRENISKYSKDIELIEGDIRSTHTVNEAVKNIDVILHQAALPSVPRSINDPITSNDVNVGGTLNILDSARLNNVKRVVFASSSSIYGDNPELPKKEDMNPNPLSPYAVSKLTGEKYCLVFSQIYSLETVCLRYFNVFGPNQDPNSQYSAVIPKFIKSALNDEEIIIYGDGEQSRDFTYVANVVYANLLASEIELKAGIVMNCACHDRISLNELIKFISDLTGKKITPKYDSARTGDIKHSFADISLAKNILKYEPIIDFNKGLLLTYQSFI